MAANTLQTAAALRSAGAIVEEVDLAVPRALVLRAVSIHFNLIFAAMVDAEVAAHGDLMCDYALDFASRSRDRGWRARGLLDEYSLLAKIYEPVGALLEQYDVLLCPTIGTRGLVAGDSYVGHGLTVGGVELEHYFDSIMTAPFNVMSRCPVLAVPSGFADNGVPTGDPDRRSHVRRRDGVPCRRRARAGAALVRHPRAATRALRTTRSCPPCSRSTG